MDKGPVPSDGDVSMGAGILATTIIVTILADTVVALRFIVRKWIVKNIGWDDWCILGAVLGITIGMALVIVEVSYGFGRHKYYLTSHQVQEFQKYSFGEWIQTFATLMWTKISICLFLLRITISKAFIRPLQAAIIILVLSNVILTVLWVVQCDPVALAWDLTQQGTCFSVVQIDDIILAQASKKTCMTCGYIRANTTKLSQLSPISSSPRSLFSSFDMFRSICGSKSDCAYSWAWG